MLTKPEFMLEVSETMFVVIPSTEEINISVFSSLENLKLLWSIFLYFFSFDTFIDACTNVNS